MAYVFQNKIYVDWSKLKTPQSFKVLIVEPQVYLFELYARHLKPHNFKVSHCADIANIYNHLSVTVPDLCIVNPQHSQGVEKTTQSLKLLKKNFPDLPVMTVAFGLTAEEIKKLMDSGVISHMDRALTRPKDIGHIAKLLLREHHLHKN